MQVCDILVTRNVTNGFEISCLSFTLSLSHTFKVYSYMYKNNYDMCIITYACTRYFLYNKKFEKN